MTTHTTYHDATVDGWQRIRIVEWPAGEYDSAEWGEPIDAADLPAGFDTWETYDSGASLSGVTYDVRSPRGE